MTVVKNSSYENTDTFESILESIGKNGFLTIDSIERLSKMFSMQSMSKVKEIMSEIIKVVFIPSNRTIWMKLGTDKDYIIYPHSYCSCMDFFIHGILKNRKYYCKHLIAQGIIEQLSVSNPKDIEMTEQDENFKEKVIQRLELEHFLN